MQPLNPKRERRQKNKRGDKSSQNILYTAKKSYFRKLVFCKMFRILRKDKNLLKIQQVIGKIPTF